MIEWQLPTVSLRGTEMTTSKLLLGMWCLFSTLGLAKEGLLTKDTFLEMESVAGPAISPDGTQIIFTRGRVDKIRDRHVSNLWIASVDRNRIRELRHGTWQDSSPAWSPDGKRIAFISNQSGNNQIHVMWMESGEFAQLTHLEHSPTAFAWSPDSKHLAFLMFTPDTTPILPIEMPGPPEGAKWAEGAIVVDRMIWADDGRGHMPKGNTHIYLLDSRLGGTPRKITAGDSSHYGLAWATDGKTLYSSVIHKPNDEYLPTSSRDSEIYAFDVSGGEPRRLTDRRGPDSNPQVSHQGDWIAYTGYDEQHFNAHISSIYLMDSSGGSRRLWAGDLPSYVSGLKWASDDSGLYYEMGEAGSNNLFFVPVDGSPRKVTAETHSLGSVSIADNGVAAAVVSTPTRPGYLVTFRLDQPSQWQEVVDVNADVLEGIQLADAEELWFTSADGLRVQGWLIKPANFDPNKKYPMVLWIHGGPWVMYSVRFNWAFQNFSAEGYAVLFTNPRGSSGYGQEFVNGIHNSYPGKDHDDLMAGVDAALAKGWIDENNLFVCGGSGGGVLTAWAVGHTDRFAAAVSMKPVINWLSFAGTTDIPNWYGHFESYPWEDPMEYARRSPLHYVGNVTTPTMLMTGEADLRTPMSQSEEYYRALKILNKETLLVRMPGEYHGWRRPSHRLMQQLYLQAWFKKHARPPAP